MLLELIKRGAFTTRIITGAIVGVSVYHWMNQMPLPESLKMTLFIILGFWFNSELSDRVIKYFMEKGK